MIYSQKCHSCGWVHVSDVGVRLKCKNGCGVDIVLGDGGLDASLSRSVISAGDSIDSARASWIALHTLVDWAEQTITDWLRSVPAISCDCRRFATDYVRNNPPPYGDLAGCRRWSYDFHCAVDAKVGDEPMSWEQAKAEWGW